MGDSHSAGMVPWDSLTPTLPLRKEGRAKVQNCLFSSSLCLFVVVAVQETAQSSAMASRNNLPLPPGLWSFRPCFIVTMLIMSWCG